jgi:hypothetical protein
VWYAPRSPTQLGAGGGGRGPPSGRERPATVIGDACPGPPTDPARTLLLAHEPGVWAYLSQVFGRPAGPSDLVVVDVAYVELAFGGLVAQVDATFTVLAGEQRRPFVLTPAGERARQAQDGPARKRLRPAGAVRPSVFRVTSGTAGAAGAQRSSPWALLLTQASGRSVAEAGSDPECPARRAAAGHWSRCWPAV